jgi:mannosyltransferase OCH1-like enzyme
MIPLTAHFIWIGKEFPFTHYIALKSCALNSGLKKIVFHHSDDLENSLYWQKMKKIKNLETSYINAEKILKPHKTDNGTLYDLYNEMSSPAAKANILRVAILYLYGGVYLDTDTVTVGKLNDLCQDYSIFFGREKVVFPYNIKRSFNPAIKTLAYTGTIIRDLCRRYNNGWKIFRSIESIYPEAANNAVFGATRGHPFLTKLIKSMINIPQNLKFKRYALGTHLLQEESKHLTYSSSGVLPPEYFYPTGPEISEHWFKTTTTAKAEDLYSSKTKVVHWYASVKTEKIAPFITPFFIKENKDKIPYCQLAYNYLDEEGC